MREVDEILRRRPGLGTLVGEAQRLRARLGAERDPGTAGPSALTAAELYLSPHTIKAEVKSIYRKLDASSRNQAITRARELGLLEG